MSDSSSCASSDCSEAREQPNRPRRQPRHEWWTDEETGEEIHEVDFGYEWFLQLNDRGNLFGIVSRADLQSLHPTHAGFSVPLDSTSPFAAYSDIADVDRTEYEELNQSIRERVFLEGWSQQGALLPGQEALRRRDMRDMADHIDNQPREAQGPPQIYTVFDLLDLKDADSYVEEDGTIKVEKLNLYLRMAERSIARHLDNYVKIQDSTTSNYVRFLRCNNAAHEAVAHLRNNLPHTFDSAAQFARTISKTKIALAALRLSIEWYHQQNSKHWDEICDWPRSWENLLKILCEILPGLLKGVEGYKAADNAARRANAALLALKTIGQHCDRAPSFLAMFTLRELGMVMLDGKPTDFLEYQNWSFDTETTSEKAWEEMRIYLTGHRSYETEQYLINRLRSRGTRLYRGMTNLCKTLLTQAKQMRELNVVRSRVSPQTYDELRAIAQLLFKDGQKYRSCARNKHSWDCDIRTHKHNMENLAKAFDETRHKINTQTAIMRNISTNPENKDWLRKRHALHLLTKIAEVLRPHRRHGGTFFDYLRRYPRIGIAHQNLEKLVYHGEEMAGYETHSWYANPKDTDEESAWNEFKPLLDLDSLRSRKRKREFVANRQSSESRSINETSGDEDNEQWIDGEMDDEQDARFTNDSDGD